MTIYIGYSRPFESLYRNRIELLNEFQFTSICYMTLIFTDFVPTLEQQYLGGWIIICLILNFFFINMIMVFQNLAKIVSLVIRKYSRVVVRKVEIFKEKRAQKQKMQELKEILPLTQGENSIKVSNLKPQINLFKVKMTDGKY